MPVRLGKCGEARCLPSLRVTATAFALAALGFGGCAQSPQQLAATTPHGKEYFPSSVYGPASRRVVADGQPIPRGGGQYLVGKPYSVAGQTYYPSERHIVQVGNASWYGDAFHGRLTANGEIYDRDGFTAAHPTMPLPSYARVTNLRNNYSMIVRVNDRGPYASNRVMDVSRRVAESLDFKRTGTAKIKVEYVGRASLAGSDDARLYATLRTNGPAQWQGEPTMVAEAQPAARVASIVPFVPAPRQQVRHEEARREEARHEEAHRYEAKRYEAQRNEAQRNEAQRNEAQRSEARREEAGREEGRREEARRETAPRQETFRERQRFASVDALPPRADREPLARDAREHQFSRRDDMRRAAGMSRSAPLVARHELPMPPAGRPVRVASRETTPHIPIAELVPPSRNHGGRPGTTRVEKASARGPVLPPGRPAGAFAGGEDRSGARRHAIGLRLARSQEG